jgi:hypothetical protein
VLVGRGVNVGVFVIVRLGVREGVGVADNAAMNAFICAVRAADVASRLRSIVGVDEGTVAVGDGVIEAVDVLVGVNVNVGVSEGVNVKVGVLVGRGVKVGVFVTVGRGVRVDVGVKVLVGVNVIV